MADILFLNLRASVTYLLLVFIVAVSDARNSRQCTTDLKISNSLDLDQPLTLHDIRIRLSVSLQFIYVFTSLTVSSDQDLVSLVVNVLVPWVFIRFVI